MVCVRKGVLASTFCPKVLQNLSSQGFLPLKRRGLGSSPNLGCPIVSNVARFPNKIQRYSIIYILQYTYYIYIYIYIYAYVHAKLCIHIMYVYVNTYIHTYMYVCIYIYIHILVCQKQHVLNSFFFMSCTYANSAANI